MATVGMAASTSVEAGRLPVLRLGGRHRGGGGTIGGGAASGANVSGDRAGARAETGAGVRGAVPGRVPGSFATRLTWPSRAHRGLPGEVGQEPGA